MGNARIILDGATGISMSALKIKGDAVLSAAFRDSLGGLIKVSQGSLKGQGIKYSFATHSKWDYAQAIYNFASAIVKCVSEGSEIALSADNRKKYYKGMTILDGISDIFFAGHEAYETLQEAREEESDVHVGTWEVIVAVVETICTVFDTVIEYAEKTEVAWAEECAAGNKNVTKLQALKLTLLSMEFSTAMGTLIAALVALKGGFNRASILAGSDGLTVTSAKLVKNLQDQKINLSPLAGIV